MTRVELLTLALVFLFTLHNVQRVESWLTYMDACETNYSKDHTFTSEDETKTVCSFARRLVCSPKHKKCICGSSWVGMATKWYPDAPDDRAVSTKPYYLLMGDKGKPVKKFFQDGLTGDCRVPKGQGCDPIPCTKGKCDCMVGYQCLDGETKKPIPIPAHGTWHSGICLLPYTGPDDDAPTPKPGPTKPAAPTKPTAPPPPVPTHAPGPVPEPAKPIDEIINKVNIYCPDNIIFDNTTRRMVRQHPYIVLITYESLKYKGEAFRCTGVIYSSKWIITSYQCALPTIQRDQGKPTYRVGISLYGELVLNIGDTSELYRHILRAVTPSELNLKKTGMFDNLDASIALLELNAPIVYSKFTKAIKLATASQDLYSDGDTVVFSGWQVTVEKTQVSVVMRKFSLTLLPDERTTRVFGRKFNLDSRFSAVMTTGDEDDITCYHDLGGGMIKIVMLGNFQAPVPVTEAVLIGILPVSMCHRVKAKVDIAKVEYFTRVAYFTNWAGSVAGAQDMDWEKFS